MASSRRKKDQQINVPGLKVDNNIISYSNSFICLKNISLISISPIPANGSWVIAIIMALGGLYMLLEEISTEIGGTLTAIGVIWFLIVVISNSTRGINLAVTLNSGNTVYFHCSNEQFLRKVLVVLLNSIKDTTRTSCYINFQECTIQNSNILNDAEIINS